MYKLTIPNLFGNIISPHELFESFNDSAYSNICDNNPDCGQVAHDIEETGENKYQLTLSVPGFNENDLKITSSDQSLLLEGEIKVKSDDKAEKRILYKGILTTKFKKQFQFAEKMKVNKARLENGLLYIDLELDSLKTSKVIAIENVATKKVLSQEKCCQNKDLPQ